MKTIFLIWALICSTLAPAVTYDDAEIRQLFSSNINHQTSASLISDYFTAKNPDHVITTLLKAEFTPLQREFHLHNLLTEISQQPPQDFFQNFIDSMKQYPVTAMRNADEGHLPVAVFNINSKAHGIENIWTVYRTEQRFNQLLVKNLQQATQEISSVLKQKNELRAPQWLGIKNSVAAMNHQSLEQLTTFLLTAENINGELDAFFSYIGLETKHEKLIELALSSMQPQVRQQTLRHISQQWPLAEAKAVLIDHAQSGPERKFSTSLLSQFSHDQTVEQFLIKQLGNPETAANAAFALSLSDSLSLPGLLKNRYINSNNRDEKNHLLLALKLNPSKAAKITLNELNTQLEKDSAAARWLQTFDDKSAGDKP